MALPPLEASTSQRTLNLLKTFRDSLIAINRTEYTSALVQYLLFPLIQIIKRNSSSTSSGTNLPDRILQVVFEALTILVDVWKRLPASTYTTSTPFGSSPGSGLDVKHWEQLWVFTALVVGGPIQSAGAPGNKATADKGKGKRLLSEETELAGLVLLDALLGPCDGLPRLDSEDDSDWTFPPPAHPQAIHINELFSSKLLQPILLHTISTLLDVTHSPNIQLQLRSLTLLDTICDVYLARQDKVEMLAVVMPGLVSGVVKVVGSPRLKSDVAVKASRLLQHLVVCTLDDDVLRHRGVLRDKVTNLQDLAGVTTVARKISTPPTPTAFPKLTEQYLSFTSTQLKQALQALLPILTGHESPDVRGAAVDLASALALRCQESLVDCQAILLGTLFRLTQDPFDQVSLAAKTGLESIKRRRATAERIRALLASSMNAFPSAVFKAHADTAARVVELSTLLTAIARSASSESPNAFRELLGPRGDVKKWGWHLIACLELSWEQSRPVENKVASLQSRLGRLGIAAAEDTAPIDDDFPLIPLRFVESPAVQRQISTMLEAIGKAAGSEAGHAVHFFLSVVRAKRNTVEAKKASAALWIVERLLRGIAAAGDTRSIRKLAKDFTRILLDLDDDDGDVDPDTAFDESETADDREERSITRVEHTRGLKAVSLLGGSTIPSFDRQTRKTRRLLVAAHRELVKCLALSSLTVCAEILSASFRPLLLNALYFVLAQFGSPHLLVRTFARISLDKIAYHTAYASASNMIMENVDYVINIVSQRLTYRKLSPLAPMVLISMINLVGEPIVPLVQDVVDDIFDALDDYHGYETLCTIMLAVLDSLIKAMEPDDLSAWTPKPSTAPQMRRADATSDLQRLRDWLVTRRAKRASVSSSEAPPVPWSTLREQRDDVKPSDEEVPPTRSQAVCKQILDNSIPYLTHASPFIRAKVLSLMAGGVPVLMVAERETDLLPAIDRAWPFVINRLNDRQLYVQEAAAAFIESLAHYAGDWVSKRIMDTAWPAFKALLAAGRSLDARTALVKPGSAGDPLAKFAASHRLHRSMISVMHWIAQEVPIRDRVVWEIILVFRPFLDINTQEELRRHALDLYRSLATRDGDAVWLALRATAGLEACPSMAYLRNPGLDISAAIADLLTTS